MSLKPLGDRVVVTFKETEEKTSGGLVLAGNSHEATKSCPSPSCWSRYSNLDR